MGKTTYEDQKPIEWNKRIFIDWQDLEGKTIKTVKKIGDWNYEVEITFTDGFKVEVGGGSSSGDPVLDIYIEGE